MRHETRCRIEAGIEQASNDQPIELARFQSLAERDAFLAHCSVSFPGVAYPESVNSLKVVMSRCDVVKYRQMLLLADGWACSRTFHKYLDPHRCGN